LLEFGREVGDDWDGVSNWFCDCLGPFEPGFVDVFIEESYVEWPAGERGDTKKEVEV
jgi:hypothetical protein